MILSRNLSSWRSKLEDSCKKKELACFLFMVGIGSIHDQGFAWQVMKGMGLSKQERK